MLTLDQKKKLIFLHHATWCLAKELDDAVLIAKISEFRNSIEQYLETNYYLFQVNTEKDHNLYCRYLYKGGVLLLNDVIPF